MSVNKINISIDSDYLEKYKYYQYDYDKILENINSMIKVNPELKNKLVYIRRTKDNVFSDYKAVIGLDFNIPNDLPNSDRITNGELLSIKEIAQLKNVEEVNLFCLIKELCYHTAKNKTDYYDTFGYK